MCCICVYQFMLIVVLAVHGAFPPPGMKFQDLTEFLGTTERIWLYQRSYPRDDVTCVNYENVEVTDITYLYDLKYVIKEEVKQRFGVGMLGKTQELVPYMNISQVIGSPWYQKYFVYRNLMQHCAVFAFLLSGKPQCELYIWESSLNKTYKPGHDIKICEPQYEKICDTTNYTKYILFWNGCWNYNWIVPTRVPLSETFDSD
ncbi:uncharacterized protein LOC142563771 [Dermacentor variabilis]|uniref:uncharacterized protein LOC142563771 n=1 Tax=Dermacentor variabilis TaxID=34621 RepID=UPI003F5C505E